MSAPLIWCAGQIQAQMLRTDNECAWNEIHLTILTHLVGFHSIDLTQTT